MKDSSEGLEEAKQTEKGSIGKVGIQASIKENG